MVNELMAENPELRAQGRFAARRAGEGTGSGRRGRDREARRVHRPLRHQSVQPEKRSHLGGELRSDGLRHGRHHVACRRTTSATSSLRKKYGLEIRVVILPQASEAAGPGEPTRPFRTPATDSLLINSGPVQRDGLPGSDAEDGRTRRAARLWQGDGHLSAEGLGHLTAALLGHAHSHAVLRAAAGLCRCRKKICRCCCRRMWRSR